MCHKAEFTHLPLEQEKVTKEANKCSQNIHHHFQTKPVLHFQFLPENATAVRSFVDKLDTYAQDFDLEESKDFNFYPVIHDQSHETIKFLNGLCGCELRARNQYLDNWNMNYYNNSDTWRRTPI